MNEIRMVLSDIDGVWTDGSLYFSGNGESLKRFSVYDGWGVRYCRNLGIPVGIVTAESVPMARLVAEKFKTPHIFTGVVDKLAVVREFADSMDIPMESVAYIGDDLNDLPLLQAVGFSGCPANAPVWIRQKVRYVCKQDGGSGAFREFVETILQDRPEFLELLEIYAREGRYVEPERQPSG
jgi:3-deoxy-D-manno-octulosonate 8-phosphate phosphatase (KDO 8-P phosphatase)